MTTIITRKNRHELCSEGGNIVHSGHIPSKHRSLSPICLKPGKGSLTLEAALAVPLFMLFFTALISFLVIMDLQSGIQTAMENTARSMGKKAYILERIQQGDRISGNETDSDTETLISAGINPTAIKLFLAADPVLRNRVSGSRIVGGTGGLYTFNSSYDSDTGILDMVVAYDYSVPWLPAPVGIIRFVQRMNSHVWIGKSLESTGSGSKTSGSGKVYVTPNGSVYH
ncbi:MAG: pilus assembly protein, partial [Parasporobacterium sp.]|nr:pilus assembly protein [Parasporobacterium sp.]